MAVEIPKDLITKLQISLRNQANVPSYDPDDPSLPTLPSNFPQSISISVSDSPHHLPCRHCKAPLLRGPDSLLCILCGKYQTNSQEPPQPIKFKSTSGYRWFLNSLDLDGSEIVGESVEGNESKRGSREEFRVSDILDLEIRWNDAESDKFESGFKKNNPLNLAGLDLDDDDDDDDDGNDFNDDDFLVERKGDSVSVPSQGTLAVKKETDSTGSNAFESSENLGSFEKFQGSKSSGSVSGWQADFQSADSRTDDNAVSSKPFDHFLGSSEDISSNMDTVFGQDTNLFGGQEKGNQTSLQSKTSDRFQDDMQSPSISGVRLEKENTSSSGNFDWIQGDQAQISSVDAPGKKTTDDDDSFDAWNDFKGSSNIQDAAHTADGLKSMHPEGYDSFSGLGAGSESTDFETHPEVSKSFDHFAGSSADLSTHMDSVFGTGKDSFHGKAVDNTTSSHSTNWFQDDLWSNSTSGTLHHAGQSDANVGDKNNGMLGILNNSFVSMSRIQDDQWPTSSNKTADNGTNDGDYDSFGAWNDFKSSDVLDSSISSSKEPAIIASSTEEKSSDLFSGWDADFQSAKSKNMHEEFKSSDPFVSSSINLSESMDTVFASGKNLVDTKAKDGSTASDANSWFQDDVWSNSISKLIHQAENSDLTVDVMDSGPAQSVRDTPSMNVDWFPDDQWLTGNNKVPDRKTVEESENLFADWGDFKSSATKQDAFSNSWKQVAKPDKQTIDDGDDLSAAWNDFTSSTSVKDSSSVSFRQTLHHEKPSPETSEIHLFSMDSNSHDNNFGSFSHPDFFSGAFSNQNGSTDINIMRDEAPVLDRVADANVRGGNNHVEVAKDGDFSSATTGSKTDDIEILMSQMHDLSFMLESNLSIPPKV